MYVLIIRLDTSSNHHESKPDIGVYRVREIHKAILPAVYKMRYQMHTDHGIDRLTSMGSNIVKMAATINNAADTKTGLQNTKAIISSIKMDAITTHPFAVFADVVPLSGVVAILIRGAISPPMRFSAEQSASPVPR